MKKEEKEQKENDEKYIWNLKDIYKTKKEFLEDIEKIKNITKEITKLEGKLKKKTNMQKYFLLSKKMGLLEDKVSAYVYLNSAINMENEKTKEDMSKLDILEDFVSEKTMFVLPEISKIEDSILKEWIEDKDFEKQKFFLEKILEQKKHIYNKDIEQIIDYASAGKDEIFSMYNFLSELEMPFDDAEDKRGKKYPVTNSKYSSYLESKDEKLRKTAMFSKLEAYKKFNNTLSSAYIGLLKSAAKNIKLRKYDSYLESKLKGEDLNKKVYNTLLNEVEKNLDIIDRYRKLRYKIFKKVGITEEGKRIKPWDSSLKPFELKEKKIEYEEAIELVLKGLSLFGDNYTKKLKDIFSNRYIDVFPRKGKESGGFNLDIYNVHPYILLNYDKTYDDVTTIAHELGHAMHGIFVSESQDYELSGYNIMLAETASTTNEVIMANYLIEEETNKIKKAQSLINFIDTIIATLVVQAMFSRFEEMAFEKAEKNEILTPDILNDLYKDINKKYYKNIYSNKDKLKETKKEKEEIKKINELKKYSWTRVPHFFRPFYVYKYSIGITAAINIYKNIEEKGDEYIEKYFTMLKSGGSKKVLDTFKLADIDLEKEETYKKAFMFLKEKIDELEKLINEI